MANKQKSSKQKPQPSAPSSKVDLDQLVAKLGPLLRQVLNSDEKELSNLSPKELDETESWLDQGLNLIKEWGPTVLEGLLGFL